MVRVNTIVRFSPEVSNSPSCGRDQALSKIKRKLKANMKHNYAALYKPECDTCCDGSLEFWKSKTSMDELVAECANGIRAETMKVKETSQEWRINQDKYYVAFVEHSSFPFSNRLALKLGRVHFGCLVIFKTKNACEEFLEMFKT